MDTAQTHLQTEAEGSTIGSNFSLNLGGKLVRFLKPVAMGIVNLTPNSFYDGGRYNSLELAEAHCAQLLKEGATFLDLGGNSTKPGAPMLSAQEEMDILMPILTHLLKQFPEAYFSIDTFNSLTAKAAIEAGAHLINDVSAGNLDGKMFETIAELNVPYVAMHMQGTPVSMQDNPSYDNVALEVIHSLSKRVNQLHALGLNDIILDPGFGFGKSLEHNYQLLNALPYFKTLGKPLLVGVSRKSMVYKLLQTNSTNALNGTSVVNTIALQKGADILRVHDVKAAVEAINIVHYTQNIA
jgi:dihydropteroate synthase